MERVRRERRQWTHVERQHWRSADR